jgi:hypothetical protein
MSQYKVPQNVEAEDKILGPLTLKQFIYAVIGLAYGFLMFALFQKLIFIWIIIGLPPMLFMLALGLYQREDQPLETYVLAVLQFFVRPRVRIWQKEPIAEVFRVEPPPPKPEYIKRDPREVRSQLAQLADLVDTRGWSAKEPELQDPEEVPVVDMADRIETAPAQTPNAPTRERMTLDDDMLADHSQAAQNLNILIENTVKSVREEAVTKMHAQPAVGMQLQSGFITQPAYQTQTVATTAAVPIASSTSVMTSSPSGDILKLATEGGDLSVAQIAAQAHRQQQLAEGQTVNIRNGNTASNIPL